MGRLISAKFKGRITVGGEGRAIVRGDVQGEHDRVFEIGLPTAILWGGLKCFILQILNYVHMELKDN